MITRIINFFFQQKPTLAELSKKEFVVYRSINNTGRMALKEWGTR